MLGAMYDVVARYKVDTTGVDGPLNSSAKKADGLAASLGGIGAALAALGGTAALGVLGSLGSKLVELNSEATEARIGVASILTLNGLGTFERNMGRATALTADLRKAAKETKGETSDLINLVSTSLPGFANINPTNAELTTFAKRATAATNVLLGSDFNLGGQQLLQIFSGQAGSDNRLFQAIRAPLMKELGINSTGSKAVEEFNKLATTDQRKIFTALNQVLTSFDEANNLLNNTVGGQLNALSDNANNLLLTVGGPITDLVSGKLQLLNDWFDKNADLVDSYAVAVGEKLAGAIETIGNGALWAAKNMDVLVASTATLLALQRGGGAASLLASAQGAASRGISRVGGGVVARVGGMALGQRASALGSFFAPMALRGTDNWMMGGLGQRAALMGRFGAWRARDALSRAPGALGARAVNALGLAGVVGSDRFGVAGTGRRALMLGQGVGRNALGAGAARLGLSGITGTNAWAFGNFAQRGALVAGTAGRAVAGGMAARGAGLLGSLASSGLVTGLMGLLRFAGPVGLALASVVSVMQTLQDKTNAATGTFYDMLNMLFRELDKLAMQFGFGEGEGGAAGMIKRLSSLLGETLVSALSFVVWGVAKLVEGLNWLGYVIDGLGESFSYMINQYDRAGGGLAGLRAVEPTNAFRQGFTIADERARKRDAAALAMEQKRADAARREKQDAIDAEAAANNKKKTDVNIKIEQKIETDATPERIAYKTADLLGDLFENGMLSVDRYN